MLSLDTTNFHLQFCSVSICRCARKILVKFVFFFCKEFVRLHPVIISHYSKMQINVDDKFWHNTTELSAGVTPEVHLRITQAKKHARDPSWLWNPGQMLHEVQNKGTSGPTKRTYVLQKFTLKKRYFENGLLEMYAKQNEAELIDLKISKAKKNVVAMTQFFNSSLTWINLPLTSGNPAMSTITCKAI